MFFANSGSEAVDTALKIAIAYHRVRGEGQRTRLIGRERGYHGVGFGGISVGGISVNRRSSAACCPASIICRTPTTARKQAFSRGQPEWGAHLADELERIVALHDASTIAAVIVEPMAGSTGVLVPPKGYLERLKAICDKHGILLIFDEVITGFGRLGASFAAERFGIVPDMVTCAKGLTNGTVPMGGVIVRRAIYDAFMSGPENAVELPHGYTYSGHPLAAAAALAALDIYKARICSRAPRRSSPIGQDGVHSLKGLPHVIDMRNIGLVAGIELDPIAGQAGRARVRRVPANATSAGSSSAPPATSSRCRRRSSSREAQIDELFGMLGDVLEGRRLMLIGVPKEMKTHEYRVGLVPAACASWSITATR